MTKAVGRVRSTRQIRKVDTFEVVGIEEVVSSRRKSKIIIKVPQQHCLP